MLSAIIGSVNGLPEKMNMAREHALLGTYAYLSSISWSNDYLPVHILPGNYDAAIVYQRDALQQIQGHTRTLRDKTLLLSWQQLKAEIEEEYRIVMEIKDELRAIRPLAPSNNPLNGYSAVALAPDDEHAEYGSNDRVLDIFILLGSEK